MKNDSQSAQEVTALSAQKRSSKEMKASDVYEEMATHILPKLYRELSRIRQEVTLIREHSPVAKQSAFTYREAISKALETVGGQAFVEEKKQVERLDHLDEKADAALLRFESQSPTKRAFSFRERLKLFSEHQKIRTQYNDAVERLNKKIEFLHMEPAYKLVLHRAEELLKLDAVARVKLETLERRYDALTTTVKDAILLQTRLRPLGDKQVKLAEERIGTGRAELRVFKSTPEMEKQISQVISLTQKRGLKI